MTASADVGDYLKPQARELRWERSTGRGQLYSWTIVAP
jgi:hypothetical protein